MAIAPDICLMTFYPEAGAPGLHQDKDERPETIRAGAADRVAAKRNGPRSENRDPFRFSLFGATSLGRRPAGS
jgi:hypothetical protein